MSYRFRTGRETLGEGLTRIADRHFDSIFMLGRRSDLAMTKRVHETRRAIKRLRSLLRLIAPVFKPAKAEISLLRETARQLSDSRDQAAILEALEALGPERETRLLLAARLSAAAGSGGPCSEDMLQAAIEGLSGSAARIALWRFDEPGISLISPGLHSGYRRLRQASAAALRSGEEEDIHHWRKCAKEHWHQTLLVSGACPDALRAHAGMGEALSDQLGSWRDQGLLLEAIRALPGQAVARELITPLKRQILRRQKQALRRSARLSAWLCTEKPSLLMARWTAYWRSAGGT